MKILVFGSSGYLGRVLTEKLVGSGLDVVGADVRPTGAVSCEEVDISDMGETMAVLAKVRPDAVLNVAYLLTATTASNPHRGLRVNALGVDGIFRACMDLGIPRVVYASSIAVYGRVSVEAAGDVPVDEEAFPRWPDTLYGWMKQLNEVCAEHYNSHARGRTQYIGVRLGPMQGRNKGGIFNPMDRLVDGVVDGSEISLPWTREFRWGFVHVDDAADMMVTLATTETSPKHPVYNSGAAPISMGEFVEIAKRSLDAPVDVRFASSPPSTYAPEVFNLSWARYRAEFGGERRSIGDWLGVEFRRRAEPGVHAGTG